jgi:Flp pilus assembly protein TadB
MAPHVKIGIAGVIIGLVLLWISPWLALAVIACAIAIPAIAYRMLTPEQRRRLRRARARKQIGG